MPNETSELDVQRNIDENLGLMTQEVEHLESELGALAGTKSYPEWWNNSGFNARVIEGQLQEEGADLSKLPAYYDLLVREEKVAQTIFDRPPFGDIITQLVYEGRLGSNLVGEALKLEPKDGSMHRAILIRLQSHVTEGQYGGSIRDELKTLQVLYGLDSVTDLLGIGGDEYGDSLHDLLLTESSLGKIQFADEGLEHDDDWPKIVEKHRVWMSNALSAAIGIEPEEASNYVFTASRSNDTSRVLDVIKKFKHFGVERIRELSGFAGIYSLDCYTTEQLERMESLVKNPQGISERLAQHDVIAVMVNRFGDHNNVMRNAAEDYEDENRTLFFEIKSLADIYRYMLTLHKLGVNPSTLVLAAHSSPGQFWVSDIRKPEDKHQDVAVILGRNLTKSINRGDGVDYEEGVHGYSMHNMKGMARLVEDLMQPSRALDEPDTEIQKKKIIFQACHAASEVKVSDIDAKGAKVEIGMDSIISRLGSDLIDMGVKSDVDIYGAEGGIQLHRSAKGVSYTGEPSSGLERPHKHAQRLRLMGGQIHKEEVEEIVLRKD